MVRRFRFEACFIQKKNAFGRKIQLDLAVIHLDLDSLSQTIVPFTV